ncbi:MAG TPA: TIGR01459 family HAD-type hydrolase [Hyphomicrobiaceae bacterium]|nr:TIGR01459 family HAD-type hydrolase [Hyphomicrobiaceae bacterium]
MDIWGVMHNGAHAHASAVAACQKFRAGGGTVVLLSNAPRPFAAVVPYLDELGVARDSYDAGVTSGDATRDMIAEWQGKRMLHIGPERDRGLFAGYDVTPSRAEDADIILCSGLYHDDVETPADYAEMLAALAARGVPMICANPDIVVERGHRLIYCAGALAQDYEQRGGPVTYAGKPHLPIYERVFATIEKIRGPVPHTGILCIGDGIETDMRGAHAAGLKSLFIASAIHAPGGLSPEVLTELFAKRPFAPVAAMAALAW